MLAKSGQKTALAGDWPKAIASQGWLNEGRRRGDIASASPAPMTDIANILRRNGQFSSGTSLHSVKQAPACWGLRPQSPKREASADKATAAPHVAAALCQAQGWLPRISPILNVPSPADWRNLDATAVLIARPSPKLPRGPETLYRWPAKTAASQDRCTFQPACSTQGLRLAAAVDDGRNWCRAPRPAACSGRQRPIQAAGSRPGPSGSSAVPSAKPLRQTGGPRRAARSARGTWRRCCKGSSRRSSSSGRPAAAAGQPAVCSKHGVCAGGGGPGEPPREWLPCWRRSV